MEPQLEKLTAQPLLEQPPARSPPPGVGRDLEEILSDTESPRWRRLRRATWAELKLLFPLAGPAVTVYLLNNLMSLSTRIFSGHLGNLELAAATLGNNGIQLFAYGLMVISFPSFEHLN